MNKKKLLFVMAFFGLAIAAWTNVHDVESANKTYYAGDAISYHDQIIVGSVNMGYAQIFRVNGSSLDEMSSIRVLSKELVGVDKGSKFYDLIFNEENGRLFMYAVDGRFFYKYDVTNLSAPELVGKQKDNSWDWFVGLEKFKDRIVTIGTKGIKVWSYNMIVVDNYKIKNNYTFNNMVVDADGRYMLNASSTQLEIYNLASRSLTRQINIESKDDHNRTAYMSKNNIIYVADDNNVRSYDLGGRMIAHYDHKGTYGYDAQIGELSGDLYVSDGVGIIRLDPSTLKEIDWKHTAALGEPGGWAMGMKVLAVGGKEKVVVFNNTAILVLDEKLNLLAHHKATEENIPEESLSLVLDKYAGMPGFNVMARGTGFGPSEDLDIYFAGGNRVRTQADKYGRFVAVLTVPNVQPGMVDVKVNGLQSALTFSTSFTVVK